MEYTQAYQFIAKPVALNDVSKEKEKIVGGEEVKESSAKAVSANTEKESNITSYFIYIVFAVLLTALIIFLILRYFRNKNQSNKLFGSIAYKKGEAFKGGTLWQM